jgi:serine/threonine-protein kinase
MSPRSPSLPDREPRFIPAPGDIACGLVPGGVVDRYEIVRQVARGGMGSVWLAVQRGKHGFTKQVAIKTLLPEWTDDPKMRAMFLEEARISSKLHHANVAQVVDVGETASGVYLVFEWVEGRSLEQLAQAAAAEGGRLPLGTILRVLADLCAGLHAAHELRDEQGNPLQVIHRDVTPSNVLVSNAGFAKLIDFGIAKARDRAIVRTRTGFVRGTPQYMAPEQATRDPMDRRADVWAVGAILYRLLTGAPPFQTRDALVAFLDDESSLAPLPPGVPEDVAAIVRRSMRPTPDGRYPTAEAMRIALDRAAHAPGREVPAPAQAADAGEPTQREDAGRVVVRTPDRIVIAPPWGAATSPMAESVVIPRAVVASSSPPPARASDPPTYSRTRLVMQVPRGLPANAGNEVPARPRLPAFLILATTIAALVAGAAIALAMCAPT